MSAPDMERSRGPGGYTRPETNGTAWGDASVDSIEADRIRAPEFEEKVLGSMLQAQDGIEAVATVAGRLTSEDFTSGPRRTLFSALLDQYRRGDLPTVDLTLVGEELRRRDELAIVGGELELMRLAELVPSGANVLAYVEVVLDRSTRRRLFRAGELLKKKAANIPTPLEETIRELPLLVELGRVRARGVSTIAPYGPFPVDALPEPLRGFVVSSSAAIGCDAAMVALPLLSALAAAIGNSRRIRLKSTWTEPAILWTSVVAPSGAVKSPPFDAALAPLRAAQEAAFKDYGRALETYRSELLRHEAALADWRRAKQRSVDPPAAPEEPRAWRIIVADATTEAIAPILRDNPRGVLNARDELSGWVRSFDAYRGGRGGDVARWLEWFHGRSSTIDRKTGSDRIIYVPRAAVSVTGTIQPDALRRALGMEHFADGLAARLLVAMPPQKPRVWSEAVVAPETETKVAMVFERLLGLAPADEQPVLVDLSPTGRCAWIEFFNRHGSRQTELAGDLAAAWSKLEGYAARLALILHLVREAACDPNVGSTIDETDIAAAVRLVEWFGREAERVYAVLAETAHETAIRQLVELIERRGGAMTARDLRRKSSRYRTTAEAEAALQGLVDTGLGRWESRPAGAQGGRPTNELRLIDDASADETDETSSPLGKPAGFVDGIAVPSTPTMATTDPRFVDLKLGGGDAGAGS